MQCEWRWTLDTDGHLYDDEIVVNQLRHFFIFFHDAIIAVLCSYSERFNE